LQNLRSVLCAIFIAASPLFYCSAGLAQSVEPRLDSIDPVSGVQGTTLHLVLKGSGFSSVSKVVFSGNGVLVQSARFTSSTTLEATVVLSARPGAYSVTVSNGTTTSNDQPFLTLPATTVDVSELQVGPLGSQSQSGPRFYDPFHVWVNGGYAYVTDYANSEVKRVSLADGSVTTLAGSAGGFGTVDGIGTAVRFGQPAGIWADDNNVFIADAYFDTIRQISLSTGQVTTLAGAPNSVSGSADGTRSAARFQSPNGLWGDGTNLYVCDTLNFTVRKVAIATGQVTTLAGMAGVRGGVDGVGPSAQFYEPRDIWGDSVFLYVADASAIRKVTIATGEVRTISGSPAIAGYTDGLSSQARFGLIDGIWGDGTNLFVADSGNSVIRKVSLETGTVTTLAGFPLTDGNVYGRGLEARFDNPTDIAGNGSVIFIIDRMNSDIKQGTAPSSVPVTPPLVPGTPPSSGSAYSEIGFSLQIRGGASQITSGEGNAIQTGYGRLLPAVNGSSPSGLAVFGYRRDGVLVSEATVPVSQAIRDGRIPTEIGGPVNTGIAIANPNIQAATIAFYFTDAMGIQLYSGTVNIPGGGLISSFLNESPFAPPNGLGINLERARTFTFSSSLPIGVTALRGFTNERSDFLVTTLPVTLSGSTDSAPLVFAHYADGGGWKTQLVLVNPTEGILAGLADFFNDSPTSAGISGQTVPYSIAPRSAVRLQLSGNSSETRTGWIRVTPFDGMVRPSGLLIFSFQENGITLTESGVPGMPAASALRVYVEAAGDFDHHEAGSMQSGFALSNSSGSPTTVDWDLLALDGTPTGLHTSTTIPAYGHVAMFLDQLPSFQELQTPFQGFLRISDSAYALSPAIGVVGLRGRYNERGDFLITTTTPSSESELSSSSTQSLFPYFVNGGGYTTQFILSNSSSGQVSTGSLIFVGATGAPLALPLRQ